MDQITQPSPEPDNLQLTNVSSKGIKPIQLTQRQTKQLKVEFKKFFRAKTRETKRAFLVNSGVVTKLTASETHWLKQQALQQFAQEKGLTTNGNDT